MGVSVSEWVGVGAEWVWKKYSKFQVLVALAAEVVPAMSMSVRRSSLDRDAFTAVEGVMLASAVALATSCETR